MSKDHPNHPLIVQVIAWNMDYDRWDYEDGETSMIEWIVETYEFLSRQSVHFLAEHLYENSLLDEEGNPL